MHIFLPRVSILPSRVMRWAILPVVSLIVMLTIAVAAPKTLGGESASAGSGAAASAKPAMIVFAIAEDEYHAKETLPAFSKDELEKLPGVKCIYLISDSKTDLPGLAALKEADLLVMFMRRRALPPDQVQAFKDYFESGKPVVGIRTACHSFQTWLDFDGYEFGSHYHNHYPANKSPLTVTVAPNASGNPILSGVAHSWQTPSSLYKMLPLTPECVTLLNGIWQDKPAEPIAWTTTHKGGRIFFTTLGAIEDFKDPDFRRLLLNGILWTLDRPIEGAAKS